MSRETASGKGRGLAGLGPGLLVAATGVGAGDLIAAAVAGRQYGLAVLWVVVVGAGCKWLLNEGIARWQLATGESIISAWATRMPRWVSWYFGGYLVIWGFLVGGALGSACGVALKTLWPDAPGSVGVWAGVHALLGLLIVRFGRYQKFERIMQVLIALMFVFVISCGLWLSPSWGEVARGLIVPTIPTGSVWVLLSLMGGVGGSATLLCYGYWMKEKGWQGVAAHPRARWDLLVAYTLTAAFAIAMVVLAAGAEPDNASGTALVLALSERLEELLGVVGKQLFLAGFWCAVFSSLLGVWQGVPYLFNDWWLSRFGQAGKPVSSPTETNPYRWFLVYLAIPPLLLQVMERPLLVVVIYAVVGAFFMPLLGGTLLVLNNRTEWVGALRNGRLVNAGLLFSLIVFGALFVVELYTRFSAL